MKTYYIGADISKDTIDYHNEPLDKVSRIPNTAIAIRKWIKGYDKEKSVFVAEPTGTYSDKFFQILSESGFKILVASPSKSHNFGNALGLIHKNDKSAARLLSKMGTSLELPVYTQQSQKMRNRKQIQMAFNALSKQKQQLGNQLHALEQHLYVVPEAKKALEISLETVEQQLHALEKQLESLDDEETEQFNRMATSVTGIGNKSSRLLLIYTDGLKLFDSAGALLSFTGIVPYSHSSGTSVNKKGRMTKKGASQLRACLYNAARSAKQHNNACKAIFERLRKKGKPYKVAMMAVIKKLLQQVFAVVKSNTKFDNELYLKNLELKKITN